MPPTKPSTEYIFGKNPVREALKANSDVKEVLVVQNNDPRLQEIVQLCISLNVPYTYKKQHELELIEKSNHQGVIAFLTSKQANYYSLSEYFQACKPKPPYFFMILDSIQDPRNFGAILRSCDHFAINAVIVPKDRSAQIGSIVSKTSSGAIHHLPIIQVNNLVRSINELKKKDVWVYGLDVSGDTLLHQSKLKGNIAIIVGSEGEGMRRLIRENCDFLIQIPNKGHVDSLNVSVACGIVLYEAVKQRDYNELA